MSEFMYLYREPALAPLTPQEMQARMQKWLAWFKDLEQRGHLATYGHPLVRTEGGVVRDKKGSSTDGPYAETKDIVIGYTIVETRDLEEAMKLAAGCPVLDFGGLVEVRPILKF